MKILRQEPAKHSRTPYKVAIVTGLSNPWSAELSPDQQEFLRRLSIPNEFLLQTNFPFTHAIADREPNGLVRASLANSIQFLSSLRARYRRLAKPHWDGLFGSADRHFLITGSCGLQLIPKLKVELSAGIEVLALGPVCGRLPECKVTRVVGSKDVIARLFSRSAEHRIENLGHMDYWRDSRIRELASTWLTDRISRSSAPEATFP